MSLELDGVLISSAQLTVTSSLSSDCMPSPPSSLSLSAPTLFAFKVDDFIFMRIHPSSDVASQGCDLFRSNPASHICSNSQPTPLTTAANTIRTFDSFSDPSFHADLSLSASGSGTRNIL